MPPRTKLRHSRHGGPAREHFRIRRLLLDLVLGIARKDRLLPYQIAHMCGTSRPRAAVLLKGRIELFNSETLIDILLCMGVVLDIVVTARRPYRVHDFPTPRFPFVEPWRDGGAAP